MAPTANSPGPALCMDTSPWRQDPAWCLSLFFTVAPGAGTPLSPPGGLGPPSLPRPPRPAALVQTATPDPSVLFFTAPFRGTGASKQGHFFQYRHAALHVIKYQTGRETTSSSALQPSSLPFCESLDQVPSPSIAPFTPSPSPGTEEPALKMPLLLRLVASRGTAIPSICISVFRRHSLQPFCLEGHDKRSKLVVHPVPPSLSHPPSTSQLS